jgi:hypothetical protein
VPRVCRRFAKVANRIKNPAYSQAEGRHELMNGDGRVEREERDTGA